MLGQRILKLFVLLALITLPSQINSATAQEDDFGGCGNPCRRCTQYEAQLCCQTWYYTESQGWVPLGDPEWIPYLP